MIITRTPFRISIGGGGTDLASYYEKFGGFVIAAAINKYTYIALHNRTFSPDYFLKYSQMERVDSLEAINHRIIKAVLKAHEVKPGVEIAAIADLPSGTGLGSSGAFTVGLLKAVHAFKLESVTPHNLAEEAADIEIHKLKEPIGKQDQFIASFGGLNCFEFMKDGNVRVSPLRVSRGTLQDLQDHLLLFYTGISRSASQVLEDQKNKSETNDSQMLENLHFIKELGLKIKDQLESGDTQAFANSMHEHWLVKAKRSSGISSSKIDGWYQAGRNAGAIGGKIIGAGGGGFLLFYTRDPKTLREAMQKQGLSEVRFQFELEGSKILVQDSL